MTRLDVRTTARYALGETTAAFWSDAQLNTYIQLGCSDVAWRTKCLRPQPGGFTTIGSISCDPNTNSSNSNEYQLSTYFPNYYSVTEVYFNVDGQRWRRMEPTSREELDASFPGWQSVLGFTSTNTSGTAAVVTFNTNSITSIPNKYYWSREEDMIGLYPPPNTAQSSATTGVNMIKVYWTMDAPTLSADTQSLYPIPLGLHLAVVDFTVARGLEDRGWVDRANDSWQKYYKKISDYMSESKTEREDDQIQSKGYRNLM